MADPPPGPDSNADTGVRHRAYHFLGRLARHGRRATTRGPRWVIVFGIIVLVLVHLFVILYFTGILGGH
jgi:hypothetical protein